jgi:hypothetical protein
LPYEAVFSSPKVERAGCTATFLGAFTPNRTWLPLTPITVTVISVPTIKVN